MAFKWKKPKEIWKGEGIYHLTFVVVGRKPLLGELVPLERSRAYGYRNGSRAYNGSEESNRTYEKDVPRPNDTDVLPYEGWRKELCVTELATVRLSEFALAVCRDLMALPERYSYAATDGEPAIVICGKQFMPDHLHVVVWVKAELDKSIRQVAQGFRIGVRKIAEEMGVWKRENGHVFEKPFIRTLSRKGQKRRMIDYVHANPDEAWRRKMNPDMYVIHRDEEYAGLRFDTMGKARLLDYPDRQVIALSRSLTDEEIQHEVNKALLRAEAGQVTLTGAMNKGEQKVAKAIREAGYPLVVMMLDGFPPKGSEEAKFYHPGGVYHKACGEGKLFLMAPLPENYENPRLIELTDAELKRKDEEKGYTYRPLPHDSKRWRMIAGNMMLAMIAEE